MKYGTERAKANGKRIDRVAPTIHERDIVYTIEDRFRDRWFFKWPGVVREVRGGDRVSVEFLGVGEPAARTVRFGAADLHIMEGDNLADIYRVVWQVESPRGVPCPNVSCG